MLTMPLLEGTRRRAEDEQVARQLHRHQRSAEEQFGKVMSISDDMMWRYYELATDVSMRDIAQR